MRKIVFIVIAFCLMPFFCMAQSKNDKLLKHIIDSLENIIPHLKGEEKIEAQLNLAAKYNIYKNQEKALILANDACDWSKKSNYYRGVARADYFIVENATQFDTKKQKKLYEEIIEYSAKTKDNELLGGYYFGIANNITSRTDNKITDAIPYFEKGIEISKSKNILTAQIGKSYYAIALIYSQGTGYSFNGKYDTTVIDNQKAISYYDNALKYFTTKENDTINLFLSIASNYKNLNNEEKEKRYLERAFNNALSLLNNSNDNFNKIHFEKMLGYISSMMNKKEKAIEYYTLAINHLEKDTASQKRNKSVLYSNYLSRARIYNKIKEFRKSNEDLMKAKDFISYKLTSYKLMSDNYDSLGEYESAYKFLKLYNKNNNADSIKLANKLKENQLVAQQGNIDKTKTENEITILNQEREIKNLALQKKEMEMEAQSKSIELLSGQNKLKEQEVQIQQSLREKKTKELEVSEKEKEIKNQEIKRQKFTRNISLTGLIIMFLLAGFIFRSLRIRNKQNKIITEQKEVVETQNKEIRDSIQYALRIQTAILPPQKIVKQYLENSFIFYMPKDIVAGDFYWMETVDNVVLFAACDCTGHGVPGAMVSVVCHNALNRAVREFGLTQPAAILDKTAEIVIENFSKSEEDIKDGMDISLCAYNANTKTIQWAGANNPLWLLRNGELIETKADKQPIGMNEDSKPFTNHTFKLNTTDTIYLFTDGFADQFGGATGQKKLTKKRFKELILSIQNKSLQEQGIALDKFITDYRKEIEQIDDILVMGVRI